MEIAIKEGFLDIKVFERAPKMHDERKDETNGSGLDNETKGFTKVKSMNLG